MAIESEVLSEKESTGPISNWLSKNGFKNSPLNYDHLGIEVIKVDPKNLLAD